jgi:hypothetical protein
MARGRMISKSLSTSERRAQLHDVIPSLAEFAQALYDLLVAHADDFGRQPGSVFHVKHAVEPTSPRSYQEFDKALQGLHNVGLICWFESAGSKYIEISKFAEHQHLSKKAAKSRFPEAPGNPGKIGKPRLTKQKRTEPNRREEVAAVAAPTGKLLTLFNDLHRERVGTNAAIAGAKDATLLKRIWEQQERNTELVERLMRAFFESRDPFIVRAGFTVGVFASQFGKLLAVGAGVAKPSVRPEVRELCDAMGLKRADVDTWFVSAELTGDVLTVRDHVAWEWIKRNYAGLLVAQQVTLREAA